jgi:hypothetical protein
MTDWLRAVALGVGVLAGVALASLIGSWGRSGMV